MRVLFLAGLYYTVTAVSVREKRQTKCPGDGQFLCPDGRCIDEIQTCDGYDDCWDELFTPPELKTNISSDETIALCINRRCPKFAFQCAYGGCIDKEKRCDGYHDCYDRSDEDEELCQSRLDYRNNDFSLSDGTCEVIKSPNLILECSIAGIPASCNIPAKKGTKMVSKCRRGFHKNYFHSFSVESVCLENGQWKPNPHDDCTVCGRRYPLFYAPLISHASETKYLEYPWHIGLYEKMSEGNYKYLCGGSIVHPRAIITAAHCVYDDKTNTLMERTYGVAAGKYRSSWNDEDALEQKLLVPVQNVHITIYYRGIKGGLAQDIAILELENDIQFHYGVSAVCIDWENKLRPNKSTLLSVVGWGLTEHGTVSEFLRYTKLQYYNFTDCIKHAPEGLESFITNDKICAGLGNDTIVQEGDSGGGLTFPIFTPNKKEEHYLYGIVSLKDKNSNKLAAFTEVPQYLNWIRDILELIINKSIKRYDDKKKHTMNNNFT